MKPIENKTREYKPISKVQVKILLDLLLNQNLNIREAADKLDLNYEAAKAIYRKFKLYRNA